MEEKRESKVNLILWFELVIVVLWFVVGLGGDLYQREERHQVVAAALSGKKTGRHCQATWMQERLVAFPAALRRIQAEGRLQSF